VIAELSIAKARRILRDLKQAEFQIRTAAGVKSSPVSRGLLQLRNAINELESGLADAERFIRSSHV
jgi:hypothetical protein